MVISTTFSVRFDREKVVEVENEGQKVLKAKLNAK